MAKFGEGDKRWIVDERADGTNVHHWHWSEKDCLDWSKKRLADLLENLTILDGEGNMWIKTNKVEKVEGEAYVNIRKGKVIPGYEISVKLSWIGEAKDGSGNSLAKVEGTVDLPYIADENASEDPEVKISVKDDGPVGERLRQAFFARGKSAILDGVKKYVQHMAAGGPDEFQSKPPSKTAAKLADNPVPEPSASKPPTAKEGFKTIYLTEKFHCRPCDIYDILLDENRWRGFTQSNATISREVGGCFSVFDGAVTGVNQELQQDKLIVQKWRFGSWADDRYSTVSMTFEEPEIGLTIVRLTQTDVPEEDRFGNATVVENTERGWRELIFYRIRAMFGYGI